MMKITAAIMVINTEAMSPLGRTAKATKYSWNPWKSQPKLSTLTCYLGLDSLEKAKAPQETAAPTSPEPLKQQ